MTKPLNFKVTVLLNKCKARTITIYLKIKLCLIKLSKTFMDQKKTTPIKGRAIEIKNRALSIYKIILSKNLKDELEF